MSLSTIEIPLDQKKLVRIFTTLTLLFLVGLFGFIYSFYMEAANEFWAEVFGSSGLFTFLLCAGLFIVYFPEIKKKGPGLLITPEGISENASMECPGFIPWTDIIGFKDAHELNQKYIGVLVKNPNDYLNKQKSWIKRKTMFNNYKLKGVVIAIPVGRLQCTYPELKKLLDDKFDEHHSKKV